MPNTTLSTADKQDICHVMHGLKGASCRAEAEVLATFYGVDVSRIYTVSKGVRPTRQRRADLGKRKHDLLMNEALRFAAELVWNQGVSAEIALEIMAANADRLGTVEIDLGTFRRYLREKGLSRMQKKKNRKIYRRFEADFPGQIFQFDISGVKERWVDVRTRAIHKVSPLEVSKNHDNRRADRIPLWKFSLRDDKSRFQFLRFVACPKPNTAHVAEFLRDAFVQMGVPYFLYTDNDRVIVNRRTKRGEKILNETFRECGGFEMKQHQPGQPQATGKVERSHQIIEEFEKLIGVNASFGNQPNMDTLNRFAADLARRYNNRIHSVTGMAPEAAFRVTTNPKRLIDPAVFDAAFKAKDLSLRVRADVTIQVDRISYQLPRKASDPFNLLAETGQKLEVFWLDDEDFFACVTPTGDEYIVEKCLAKADGAFEQKELPETAAQRNRKSIEASQEERIKAVKKQQKTQDEPVIKVPGFSAPLAGAEAPELGDNVSAFPQRIETGNTDVAHRMTHQVAGAARSNRELDMYAALDLLQRQGKAPTKPCDELKEIKTWLHKLFDGAEFIMESEMMGAFEARNTPAQLPTKLAAVK